MRKVFFISFCAFLLSRVLSVQAASQTALQAIANTPITVRTHVVATAGVDARDGSNWPKYALYVNNGKTYDGPQDYGDCNAAGNGCGTLNLYPDKLQAGNCGSAFCTAAVNQVIETQIPVSKLVVQAYPNSTDTFVTKLTYVFFNDYWNPGTTPVTDRDFAITKIEFVAPNGTVIDTFTPATPTMGVEQGTTQQVIGAYIDYGLVNAEGVSDSEQNGMVRAFDKVDTETIAQNNSRANGKWLLTKEGSINIITMSLADKIIAAVSPGETPPPATNTVKAASDGTLPWSKNTGQNRLGPTAAWTDKTSHVGTICNGTWCWLRNFNTGKLENGGGPIDLKTGFGAGTVATNGVSPWDNGGPTSGWEEYKNSLISLSNQKYMWLWGTGGWAANGQGFDLSVQNYWKDTVASADGTTLFSGKGVTAAWTDKLNSREYLCNGKWCWVFNYEELRWHNQDSASKGRPFDVTSLFNMTPSSSGVSITTNGGPTVGWTNDVSNISVVCNEGFCWRYKNKTGSHPDLADITWEGPVSACEQMGESASVCGGGGDNPQPIKGDFNQSNQVDIFDYNLLISKYASEFCDYNLAGTCSIDASDVEAFMALFDTRR